MKALPAELALLAQSQAGLLSVPQASLHHLRRREIERRIARGNWQWVTNTVFALQIAPLSRSAQLWAASLDFENCALAGSSALEWLGLPKPVDSVIHLIGTPAGRIAENPEWILHTTKEFAIESPSPDRVSTLTAVAQCLRWARSDRQGVFQAIWAIQRGLVELEQLQDEVTHLKKSPGTANARRRLRLIAPGVHSLPEFDFARECRRRGLPEPDRQRQRRDSQGRARYTDVEFRINRRVLVVEIDGCGHLATDVHIDDQWRANELMLQGAPVLRIPALALRIDPEPFFAQLIAALRQLNLSST